MNSCAGRSKSKLCQQCECNHRYLTGTFENVTPQVSGGHCPNFEQLVLTPATPEEMAEFERQLPW